MVIVIICIAVFIVEASFKPRIDYTRDKVLLLWYGVNYRNFIKLN